MSSHNDSSQRIAADILIAALASDKIAFNVGGTAGEIAKSFKLIHEAVAATQSSILD